VLIETFVESGRFKATSYRAAGWVHLGQTAGRGKLDRTHLRGMSIKDVYCLPLAADFRRHLTAPP
jgi:hypothetical protein